MNRFFQHSRRKYRIVNCIYDCIINSKNSNGVIHCFASDYKFAKNIMNIGFHLSFTGLVTFVEELKQIVQKVPLDKIMLETDSPYLSPIPYRGRRNDPSNIPYIADMISKIKGVPTEIIMEATTKTALSFFNKLQ